MALTPLNRQEEWYQEMINAQTGNYLPSITAQDEGKVLTVENDGSWGVENVPNELPTVGSSDKDKYLHTNGSTGAVEWADAPKELPSVSGTDEGKVLTVNNSGVWVASERIAMLHADIDADGAIIKGDGNTLSYNDLRELVNVGYNFVCTFYTIAPSYFTAVVRPIQVDTYTVTFKGEYVDYNNEERYDILFECYEDDGSLAISGNIKPLSDFIVTLTPTALDYSGTMDKTVAEINAAYEAGQEIWFRVMYDQVGSYIDAPTYVQHVSGAQNEGFFANICYNNTIIVATTGSNPPLDRTTYYTVIYPLDNASGVLVVTATNGTLDKTWQEIVDAMSTTGAVLAHYDDGSIDILNTFLKADVDPKSGEYTVSTGSGITGTYVTTSASGYPVQQSE